MAYDFTKFRKIDGVVLDGGGLGSFVVPTDCNVMSIQSTEGAVRSWISPSSVATRWTLPPESPEVIVDKNIRGQEMFFIGTALALIQIELELSGENES